MRLGLYPCKMVPETRATQAYQADTIYERHRHRFELNNGYRDALRKVGLIASGFSPDERLVEIMEMLDHPFMLGVQFHPEFLSRPTRPHPLFLHFLDAAREILREGDQHPLPIKTDAHS